MRILSFTAGAATMYCGSCLRDNALAAELIGQGHDVTLLPLYTPTRTDEPNVSRGKVLFGGISVYLQQNSALFRSMPRWMDRVFDSARALKAAAQRSIAVNPSFLGEMTISMLKGEEGRQRKEFSKLLDWIKTQPAPEIVNLPNSMLLALARPLKKALGCPVVVTMQGEDSFLAGLSELHAGEAIDLMRSRVAEADAFVAVSDYYRDFMADYLKIPQQKLHVIPLGVNPKGTAPRAKSDTFTIGYFARVCPQKGLRTLCEAYRHLRREMGLPPARLEVAGYLGPEYAEYLRQCENVLEKAGLKGEYRYHGELDRAGKIQFLRKLDVFSVPAEAEPKGLSILEALANSVPVVQPRSGTFPEIIAKTSGGLLVKPGSYESLAEGIYALWKDPSRGEVYGRCGAEGIRRHYTTARMAERTIEVYHSCLSSRT